MRKFLLMLVALFVATPGFSALRIDDVEAFKYVMEKHFPGNTEAHLEIARVYKDELLNDTKTSGYYQGVRLCRAAGMTDLAKGGSEVAKCREFVADLLWKSTGFYLEVCNGKRTTAGTQGASYDCVTDPFNYTNVQLASAVTLAKEYARVRFGDTIVCTGKYRKAENDDWVKCKALNRERYYEFKFDDVRESVDRDIIQDIVGGIYRIHTKAIADLVYDSDQMLWVTVKNKSVCDKMGESAKLFGYDVTYADKHPRYAASTGKHGCGFDVSSIKSASELSTACGIDNFEFCRSIQINTNLSTIDYMREHVAKKCNTDISNVRCDSGFKTYTGTGCATTWMSPKDDVISCHYNGQKIDFVFDDVNEAFKYVADGGQQAMPCINSDGTFDGKNCVGLDQQNCEAMQKLNEEDCPDCRAVTWDAENQMCVLGAAKFAANVDKAVKIGTVAGVAVVAVAATVFSGGTAAPGVWTVVAATANGLVITGATVQVTSEAVMTYGVFEPFVKKANLCIQNKDSACAESLVTDELNRMESYSKEFTQGEARALDEIFVKLINLPFFKSFN